MQFDGRALSYHTGLVSVHGVLQKKIEACDLMIDFLQKGYSHIDRLCSPDGEIHMRNTFKN